MPWWLGFWSIFQGCFFDEFLGIIGFQTGNDGWRNFSNVAEEEIAKQFPTERREMIFCAIHMTEKWPFFLHMMTENLRFWFWTATGDNFFFSVENQFFLFHNFNTATHGAH
jgi:hypothetical protein